MKRVVKIGGVEITNLKSFDRECYFLSRTCIYLITKDNKIDDVEIPRTPLPATMNDLITKEGEDPEKYIGWIYAWDLRDVEVEVSLVLEDRAYYGISIIREDKFISKTPQIIAQYDKASRVFRYLSLTGVESITNLEHYYINFSLDRVIVHYKVIPEV